MDRLDEILRLRAEGKTLKEIGAQFGITKERVRQILAKQGIVGRANYAGKIKYECKMCGKKCEIYSSIKKTKRGEYCSRKCWNERKSMENK